MPAGHDDAAAGERRAQFEALASEVLEPLRRYLARRARDVSTADDALADALLVLWRRLDDVPAAPGEALPWCYGVARGVLANVERSARRQHRLAERVAAVDPPMPVVGHPGDDAVDPEPVRAALASLRSPSAEVLRLWAWEQLAPAEIAVVLGVTPNAVSIRLHRAKKELAAALAVRKDGGAAGHPGGRGRGMA